jgi:hypothetical protein
MSADKDPNAEVEFTELTDGDLDEVAGGDNSGCNCGCPCGTDKQPATDVTLT